MDGTEMIEVNPILREVLEERGLYSDELMKKIAKQGSLEGIEEIPEEIRRVFVSAHEVSPNFISVCRRLSSGIRTTRCPRP